MGIAKLVSWECEREWEWLDGNGKEFHVYFLKSWLVINTFYNSTVPCIVEFTGHLLSDEILVVVRE